MYSSVCDALAKEIVLAQSYERSEIVAQLRNEVTKLSITVRLSAQGRGNLH